MALLLSTAYAPPMTYMALLYKAQGGEVYIEAHEHIVKQSWRNRCNVASSQGVQILSIPIERPQGGKTLVRDVRISNSKPWQHQHIQALRTNYGCSPYFEYYWDDLLPLYERNYKFLWDFNWDVLSRFISLLGIDLVVKESEAFCPIGAYEWEDYRYLLHRRGLECNTLSDYPRYYQPFQAKQGFIPELSVYDLLMNLGPEAILYLRDYVGYLGI